MTEEQDEKEKTTTRCPKCGEWMMGDKCGCCINMPDKELRKFANLISDQYQSWGSPTYITYDILQKMRLSILSEKEKHEEDYQRTIGEILLCNPIPASERQDDRLEPPWEVVLRIRKLLSEKEKEIEEWKKRIVESEATRDLAMDTGSALQDTILILKTRIKELEEGIRNIPFDEYGKALSNGLDSDGAWDCFCEATDKWEKALLDKKEKI